MPKGGVRTGTPGTAYSNRTDLNTPKPLPAVAGPSQEYGQAIASLRAQHAVPMAGAPTPPVQGASPAPAPAVEPMPLGIGAGNHLPLDRPTERPDEPVTTGVPVGAGPGPEAMPAGLVAPPDTVGTLLGQLAGSSDLQFLADYVNSGRR